MDTNISLIGKKQIKREFNKMAGVLLIYILMPIVVLFICVIIKSIEFFIRSNGNLFLFEHKFYEIFSNVSSNGLIHIVGTILGMIFILLYRKKYFFSYDLIHKNRSMDPKTFLILFTLFMAPQFLAIITGSLMEYILNQFGYTIMSQIESASVTSDTPSMILYAILVGPIAEEFVFRGAVLRSLEKYGKVFAITISSVLFGILHANIIQILYGTAVGLILGYIAIEYSIKWSILAHILNNLVANIFYFIGLDTNDTVVDLLSLIIFGGTFFAGCIIIYRNLNSIKEFINTNGIDKKIYMYFFTSILVVILIAINLFIAFSGIEKLSA